jgi:hypothetical protein
MSKEHSEYFRKNMSQIRGARELEDKATKDMLQRRRVTLQSSERCVKFGRDEDAIQIYEDWLKKYKEKNPDIKQDENNLHTDEKGVDWISFSDPEAEEDFVRHLAANKSLGGVSNKGIIIANYEDGKLIDPRTNQEFPEGEYTKLVQQLDSGLAYSDIDLPKSSAPTPFGITPY